MTRVYKTSERLPPLGRYVLCHHTRGTWVDRHDPEGVNWVVLRRVVAPIGGNNLVPYEWDEFGPDRFFGQDVDLWAELPRGD